MIPLRPTPVALLLLVAVPCTEAQIAVQGAGSPAPRAPQALSRAPRITSDLPHGFQVPAGEELVFHVTVTDADGDPVSLTLLDPPPGLSFAPVVAATPPVTREVRWWNQARIGGLHHFVFEARDHSPFAATRRLQLTVHSGWTGPSGTLAGDVTGDGILDVLARAPLENAKGIVDSGAIYVWKGGATPATTPHATLLDSGALPGDRLGETSSAAVQLADVTGDGILDVVVASSKADAGGLADVGSLEVWIGGPSLVGQREPSARLAVPQPIALQGLGSGTGQNLRLGDVTGDGILDVLVGSPSLLPDWAGGVFVLAGSPDLSGPTPPAAVLLPPRSLGSLLGLGSPIFGLADLDADGVQDVVLSSPSYTETGIGTGAYFWFRGGATLSGEPPHEVLGLPAGQPGRLAGASFPARDVTGDGLVDLVGQAPLGADGSGCVAIWAGGPGFDGGLPSAILTIPAPETSLFGDGLLLADVTGDGLDDVVVSATRATVGGVVWAGSIHVWAGGPGLSGTPPATADLTRLTPQAGDELGVASPSRSLLAADVTGDGTRDLVVLASRATTPAAPDETGLVLVFEGGAALAGQVTPWASLEPQPTDPLLHEHLGVIGLGQGVLLEDVTGDGVADVLAGDSEARIGNVRTGAVLVWAGGAALAGTPAPHGTLTLPPGNREQLGGTSGQGIQLADVTGDGQRDVVVGSTAAVRQGLLAVGAVFVWSGGAALAGFPTPAAELEAPVLVESARLCLATGEGFFLLDATGDGVADVVAASHDATVAGVTNAGAVYLWKGGPGLAGGAILPADTTFARAAPIANDRLGRATGQGAFFADLTGDGVLDLFAAAPEADLTGQDQGLLLFHPGPLPLGAAAPLELRVPNNHAGARLGQ